MTMIQQMILGMQNRPSSVKHPPNRLEQWALAKNNRKETFERTPLKSWRNTHYCHSSEVICCFHHLLIIWNLRDLITGYNARGLRITRSRLLLVIPVPKNLGDCVVAQSSNHPWHSGTSSSTEQWGWRSPLSVSRSDLKFQDSQWSIYCCSMLGLAWSCGAHCR